MNETCKGCCGCRPFTVALTGNPNVGKSTVFNRLTGMRQHTGNWPGKTVACQSGWTQCNGRTVEIIDTPGTYSLLSGSEEEEIARDFICFGRHDCVIAVADATCLERNLNLILQISEITSKMVLCVNLLDEAGRKGIHINRKSLEKMLGIPVVFTSARSGKGVDELPAAALRAAAAEWGPPDISYPQPLEKEIEFISPFISVPENCRLSKRFIALRLLEGGNILPTLTAETGIDPGAPEISAALHESKQRLKEIYGDIPLSEVIVGAIVGRAEQIYSASVSIKGKYSDFDRKLDRIVTGRRLGIPIMLLLLLAVFWLTIVGSNYPSELLSSWFAQLEELARRGLTSAGAPETLTGIIADGILGTLFRVVSVMLPPMAIFFPLFTLLEDSGYLPRIAFNLDGFFARAGTCGKQALTMCMGLGCNAVGVTGCRIIDSPRERLIAIITNAFMPCNGRFPAMIAVSAIIFTAGGILGSFASAFCVLCVIIVGAALTLLTSKLLSKTLLKGVPSSFTLELPPYRKPDFARVICRSILDRTLFVLGRAAAVAAPAGLVIWIMANCRIGDTTILQSFAGFLDPLGKLMGLDGYILMAFILGMPANEIVIPIVLMSYMQSGTMVEMAAGTQLTGLLTSNGWTGLTAVCFMLFSLIHFPCSTTCLTIKKETGSLKWTAISFILPTIMGVILCILTASTARLLGIGI